MMDASAQAYIAAMRAEAEKRRVEAAQASDKGLRKWLLSRAEFFDACANDREAEEKT